MGMAVRAAGDGKNVFILQFVKAAAKSSAQIKEGEWPVSSEINFFDNISSGHNIGRIDNEQAGAGFVGILGDKKQKDEHIRQALQGLERSRKIITGGEYQVIILDEIIFRLEVGLIEERDIIDLINIKPKLMHLFVDPTKKDDSRQDRPYQENPALRPTEAPDQTLNPSGFICPFHFENPVSRAKNRSRKITQSCVCERTIGI